LISSWLRRVVRGPGIRRVTATVNSAWLYGFLDPQ
jgi:hypothetical protein